MNKPETLTTDAAQPMTVPTPQHVLEEAPTMILTLERNAWTLRLEIDNAEARQRGIEAELLARVTEEQGDGGKARYGNESARKAALARALESNEEHRSLAGAIDASKRLLHEASTLRDYWANRKANARVLLAPRGVA